MPRKPGWGRVWILVAASVAALPALLQPLPVAASSTGTLFGVTGLDRSTVSSIDLGTGAVTPIAQLGLPPDFNAQVTNLTGDAATHRIFALRLSVIVPPPPANFTMIFEILTIDGQSHAVIADTPVNAPIGDIQFDPLANTMYALVPSGFQGANGVVRVDLSTGAISPVASIGPPGPFSDSMVLAPQTHTIYVSREDFSLPSPPIPPTHIIAIDSLSNTVVSTSPVLSRALRSISYDTSSNRLFGVTDCCPQDLVEINPSTWDQTFVSNVNNMTNQGFQVHQAVDPLSHTVFLPFDFFGTFPSETHIFSVDTQSGVTTSSPPIATGVDSLYFQTGATPIDTSPPSTAISISPAPNAATWNKTNVTVNLSATDPDGVGDVATIQYSATGAQPIAPTVVAGSSTTFTVTYTGNAGTYTVDQTVAITCTAADPHNANGTPGSGLASTTCANVNAPAYTFPLGPHTLVATATDIAGNVGIGSTTFTVEVTSSSLCTLTARFIQGSPNAQTSPALAKAQADRLCALLTNAKSAPDPAKKALVDAYQNGLTTLVDLGLLTPAQAAILLTLSQAL